MKVKTVEELTILQVENQLRGLKMGTKKPEEMDVNRWLIKLKPLNIGMYEELQAKYVRILTEVKNKTK